MLLRPRRGGTEPRRARQNRKRLRRFPPRGSMASRSLSFQRLPVVQARGSTTGSCLPTLRRVWPLPAACNGPGERRPGSQPIVDRRERVLARPEDRTAWVFCVRAARTLPSYRAAPFVPAYLHHPAQRNDPLARPRNRRTRPSRLALSLTKVANAPNALAVAAPFSTMDAKARTASAAAGESFERDKP